MFYLNVFLDEENMMRMDQNPNMHHKSDIKKYSKHSMEENVENQNQGRWMLALATSYVRHTRLSVLCPDRAFRLKILSNQNESKQKSFPKQEQTSMNINMQFL